MKSFLARVLVLAGLLVPTAVLAQSVDSISPSSAAATGNVSVTFSGNDLSHVTSVQVGANGATIESQSSSHVTITLPAKHGQDEACVNVNFYLNEAPGIFSPGSFCYFPVVTSINPATGPASGGTSVTITGAGFIGASAVSFGGSGGTSVSVTDDTSLTVTNPSGAGTVDVTVTTAGGVSSTTQADQFTYIPAPTIDTVSPTSGSTMGGESITISGSNFAGVTDVKFGTTSASIGSSTDTSISVTTPAGSSGAVDVSVTTPSGTTTASNAFTYVTPTPSISFISPNYGATAGGEVVTIVGTGLTGTTSVMFGPNAGTDITVNSDENVNVTTPAGSAGSVHVIVTTPGGSNSESEDDLYTYNAPPPPIPTVTGISPSSGPEAGGTTVTVTGTGFTGSAVKVGDAKITGATIVSDTEITLVTPAGTGTQHIVVSTTSGASTPSAADEFTYVATPVVTGIDPDSGPTTGGTEVTITGSGFTDASAVKFGSADATDFSVVSDTSITAESPSGTGTVDITVVNDVSGTSATSSADQFTYTSTPNPPEVTALSPSKGPAAGGNTVIIYGNNLDTVTAVSFGGTSASFDYNPLGGIINATAPAGTGTVDVTVTTPGGTSATSSADQYTYVGEPTVTGVSPASGPEAGGTAITITGTNFVDVTAVKFDSTDVSFTLDSPTSISVTTPSGTNTVGITVVTDYGMSGANANAQFTYNATPPVPVVTALTPSGGSELGGTSVKITGSYLTGATSVKFGTAEATFDVDSDNQISATSPPGTGAVYVVVTTPNGTSTESQQFTYSPPVIVPAITGISPTSGSTEATTAVIITGTGFTDATEVLFGTLTAGYTVDSDTQITAISPIRSAGTVDVRVSNTNGMSEITAADEFTYVTPPPVLPTITGISPDTGPAAGGTDVTITGSNLLNVTSVSFGSATAAFAIIDATTISAVSPAGTGTVHITVTDGSATSAISAADEFTYTSGPVGPDPDSDDAETVANRLTTFAAQTSGTAIGAAAQFGIGLGLSGGNMLDLGPQTLAFAFAPDNATPAEAAATALGNGGTATAGPLSIWLDATGSGLIEGLATGAGWQINVTGGIGYRVSPDVVIGVLGGYESFAYDSDVPDGRLEGEGYTAGAYAGARMGNVMTDLTLAYTLAGYGVEAGAAEGNFDASRVLVSGGLNGMFDLAGFEVRPSARLYALWESQEAWTDSLAGDHDEREFLTARISLGGAVSRALPIGDGVALVSSIGAYADYQGTWDSAAGDSTALSGRVTAGVAIDAGGSASVGVDGEIRGLGTDMPAWGVTGRVGGSF